MFLYVFFLCFIEKSAIFYPEYFKDSCKNYSSTVKINHLAKHVTVTMTTLIFRVEHQPGKYNRNNLK